MATRSSSALALRNQRTSAPIRRKSSGPNKKTEQLKKRLANLRKRASGLETDTKLALVTLGTPVALSLLKKHQGFELPTVGGINPNVLWGGALVLLGPTLVKGESGRMLSAAGLGMAAVGASESATAGTVVTAKAKKKKKSSVAGDEIGDDEIGDDEIGDDEIGDDEIGADDD